MADSGLSREGLGDPQGAATDATSRPSLANVAGGLLPPTGSTITTAPRPIWVWTMDSSLWVSTIARRGVGERHDGLAGAFDGVLADQRRGAGVPAEGGHDAREGGGLGERGVDGGFSFEKGAGDLFGDHAALLEHEFSPVRAGVRARTSGLRGLWFRTGLGREESSPEILERVKPRQHPPRKPGR